MVRMSRAEVFDPQEVAVAHVFTRTVRRCFLFGEDPLTGKNFDHRKAWIEDHLRRFAASFGIDLIGFAILSNHFHLILRSRPDVVATWDDTEVARRWLRLCPHRKHPDGSAKEPSEPELNAIRCCPLKRDEIRQRLSNISWWMRLLCQRVAMRANREEGENGRFFQDRYKAVRLLDDASLLACAAYVDLNPIRAAIADTLQSSDHTSVQRRMEALRDERQEEGEADAESKDQRNPPPRPREPVVALRGRADQFLSPLTIDEQTDAVGPCASVTPGRCSDKGFLTLSLVDYLQLLDWTARQVARGNPGNPGNRDLAPCARTPVLDQLGLKATVWTELVRDFGKLFAAVAGRPSTVDATRSHLTHRRFRVRRRVRELLPAAA